MAQYTIGARKDQYAFAPCGHGLVHEPHLFRSKRDKVLTCDGYPRNKKTGVTHKYN